MLLFRVKVPTHLIACGVSKDSSALIYKMRSRSPVLSHICRVYSFQCPFTKNRMALLLILANCCLLWLMGLMTVKLISRSDHRRTKIIPYLLWSLDKLTFLPL